MASAVELPFLTIDPPGSLDLDQAIHVERRGDGHRVSYAIADVGAFVEPGSALDVEAHARAVTVYAPDAKAPLHPVVLSEGAASLLPGQWRAAALWTLDLDGDGGLASASVERRLVRSVAQHTYEDVPAALAELMAEVGERRLRIERDRGGVRLAVPEQEVVREGAGWSVRYRVPAPVEEHNAQVSLLTGLAAARAMLEAGTGILRVQPAPDERSLNQLRRQARALGVEWAEGTTYPDFIRGLDPAVSTHASLLSEATGVEGERATSPSTAIRPTRPGEATSRSPPTTRTPPRPCGGSRTGSSRSAAWRLRPASLRRSGCARGSRRCRRRWRRASAGPEPSSAASSTWSRPCCCRAARARRSRRS